MFVTHLSKINFVYKRFLKIVQNFAKVKGWDFFLLNSGITTDCCKKKKLINFFNIIKVHVNILPRKKFM
jgi:hypothetical protein